MLIVLGVGSISCEKKSAYQRLVEQKYQPGAHNDSLFLGYYFGMSREEFYDHSWSLNRQRIVREGASNQSVRYEINELKSRAIMNFYPVFYRDSIYSMPVKYSYTGWAPWNRNLWADSLENEVVDLYQDRYGHKFQKMRHPEENKPTYITIEGNKRVAIYKMDDSRHVAVEFTDLDVLNRMKAE